MGPGWVSLGLDLKKRPLRVVFFIVDYTGTTRLSFFIGELQSGHGLVDT